MARPVDVEKRRALARRAARILEREGLGIPAARLADALDIKRPTLLYHFADYSQIVELALEDLLLEQAAFVLAEVEKHEHPVDRLHAQLRAVHEFHRGRESRVVFLTQAIAATAGNRLHEILGRGVRVFEVYRRDAAARIRRAIDDGTMAPCDPHALVALLRALIDGLLLQRVSDGLDLAPVHELVWQRVLSPLKLDARRSRTKTRKKGRGR